MGKTRDLFKKLRHTKGTFHAKMGIIKNRNNMDLTEREDIKKRWQRYTEKILMNQIIMMVQSLTQSQTFWSVKLFQILKNDAVKVLQSIYQHIWETQQWPQDWKSSIFIPIPEKSTAKKCSNYPALISHTSKVMLKILQARLQQYINRTSRCSTG